MIILILIIYEFYFSITTLGKMQISRQALQYFAIKSHLKKIEEQKKKSEKKKKGSADEAP